MPTEMEKAIDLANKIMDDLRLASELIDECRQMVEEMRSRDNAIVDTQDRGGIACAR